MMQSLEAQIAEIEARARDDDPSALASATELIAAHPEDHRTWNLRAYIFARSGNLKGAIADTSRSMELSPEQPAHYFDRGRYKLKLGDYLDAVDDFSDGIALCEQHSDDYYLESLYFLRADALFAAGERERALADLAHVRDDFTLWTTELRSKQELVARCNGTP